MVWIDETVLSAVNRARTELGLNPLLTVFAPDMNPTNPEFELLHPRGRDGKFITKGGRVKIFKSLHDTTTPLIGTVVDVKSSNEIIVRRDDTDSLISVHSSQLEESEAKAVLNKPAKPVKSLQQQAYEFAGGFNEDMHDMDAHYIAEDLLHSGFLHDKLLEDLASIAESDDFVTIKIPSGSEESIPRNIAEGIRDGKITNFKAPPEDQKFEPAAQLPATGTGKIPTPHELDVFNKYIVSGSVGINAGLRKGHSPSEDVKAIDSLMEKTPLPADTTLWRGIEASGHDSFVPNKLQSGDTITDLAFLSTTKDHELLGAFTDDGDADALVMEILAPAGTPHINVSSYVDYDKSMDEGEIILPRNLKLRVEEDVPSDGVLPRRIRVRIENDDTAESDAKALLPGPQEGQKEAQPGLPGQNDVEGGGHYGDSSVEGLKSQIDAIRAKAAPDLALIKKLDIKLEKGGVYGPGEGDAHFQAGKRVKALRVEAAPLFDKLYEQLAQPYNEGSLPDPEKDHWANVGPADVVKSSTLLLDQNMWDNTRNLYVGNDTKTTEYNAELRKSEPSLAAKQWAGRISKMVQSRQANKDMVLYRGGTFDAETLAKLEPGSTLHSPSFMSTDVTKGTARMYAQERANKSPGTGIAIFEIRVPKGTHVADVHYGEHVLDRNQTLHIISTDYNNGELHVVASLQAPKATLPDLGNVTAPSVVQPNTTVTPLDTSSWKKVAGQAGSNPGGFYEAPDGTRYYVKKSKSEDHARNEVLATKLYRAAGIDIPDVELANVDGVIGIASKIVPGNGSGLNEHLNDQEYLKKIQDGFAVDAWLANWDVAGLEYDNVATNEKGDPVRLDTGGALTYRAMGAPKGAAFGDTVGELDTLRDKGMNPQSAKVFAGMTNDDIKKSAEHVANISPDEIDKIVRSVGFSNVDAAVLSARLNARRLDLLEKTGLDGSSDSKATLPDALPEEAAPQILQTDALGTHLSADGKTSVKVGDKVKNKTKGYTGTVVKLEGNGQYVKVQVDGNPPGKLNGLKTSKLDIIDKPEALSDTSSVGTSKKDFHGETVPDGWELDPVTQDEDYDIYVSANVPGYYIGVDKHTKNLYHVSDEKSDHVSDEVSFADAVQVASDTYHQALADEQLDNASAQIDKLGNTVPDGWTLKESTTGGPTTWVKDGYRVGESVSENEYVVMTGRGSNGTILGFAKSWDEVAVIIRNHENDSGPEPASSISSELQLQSYIDDNVGEKVDVITTDDGATIKPGDTVYVDGLDAGLPLADGPYPVQVLAVADGQNDAVVAGDGYVIFKKSNDSLFHVNVNDLFTAPAAETSEQPPLLVLGQDKTGKDIVQGSSITYPKKGFGKVSGTVMGAKSDKWFDVARSDGTIDLVHIDNISVTASPAPDAGPVTSPTHILEDEYVPAGDWVPGYGGAQIFHGSTVKSEKDGLEGYVYKIEQNGTYVKVISKDGKVYGRSAKTLHVTGHNSAGGKKIATIGEPAFTGGFAKVNKKNTSSKNGPVTVTNPGPHSNADKSAPSTYVPKKVNQVDGPLTGAPKPTPPLPPPGPSFSKIAKYVDDEWLAGVKKRYESFAPGKKLENSNNWSRIQRVISDGNLTDLQHLLDKHYISDAQFANAKAQIDANSVEKAAALAAHADLVAAHGVAMQEFKKTLEAWKIQNGVGEAPFTKEDFFLSGMEDAREWKSHTDASNWANTIWPKSHEYNKSELASLKHYTGHGSSSINPALYNVGAETMTSLAKVSSSQHHHINNIDDAMKFAPRVPEPIIVYRGLGLTAFKDSFGSNLDYFADLTPLAGTVQDNFGYSSTSIGPKAAFSQYDVQMRIRVPAGQKAVFVWGNGISGHSSEYELLLDRGIHFYIHSVTKQGGKWHIDVEIVPPGWKP